MKQFNVLVPTYKGMIALLHDLAIRFKQADVPDIAGVKLMTHKIEEVIHLCEGFAGAEEKYMWPTIDAREPRIVDGIRRQDRHSLALLYDIRHNLLLLQSNGIKAGNFISGDFNRFMVLGIDSLERKEELVRKHLPSFYSNMELAFIWHQMLYAVSDEEVVVFCQSMLRGLQEDEVVHCLKAAMQTASNKLCLSVLKAAEMTVSAEQWKRVQNAVAEGALLA